MAQSNPSASEGSRHTERSFAEAKCVALVAGRFCGRATSAERAAGKSPFGVPVVDGNWHGLDFRRARNHGLSKIQTMPLRRGAELRGKGGE